MKLKYVVAGVNENATYIHCVPFFIKAWKSLHQDVEIRIILFANEMPTFLAEFKDSIVLVTPIVGVSTAFCSQIVRLFYPCILPNDGAVMISDIDLLPLNFDYFKDALKGKQVDHFVTFRANHMKKHNRQEVVMCYNAAYSAVWSDIFQVKSYQDMIEKMISIYSQIEYEDKHNGKGWRTDQRYLFQALGRWSKKNEQHIECTDEELQFQRLNGNVIDLDGACHWIRKKKAVDIHVNKNLLFSSDNKTRELYEQRVWKYIKAAET